MITKLLGAIKRNMHLPVIIIYNLGQDDLNSIPAAVHCLNHPSDNALYSDKFITIAYTVIKYHDI